MRKSILISQLSMILSVFFFDFFLHTYTTCSWCIFSCSASVHATFEAVKHIWCEKKNYIVHNNNKNTLLCMAHRLDMERVKRVTDKYFDRARIQNFAHKHRLGPPSKWHSHSYIGNKHQVWMYDRDNCTTHTVTRIDRVQKICVLSIWCRTRMTLFLFRKCIFVDAINEKPPIWHFCMDIVFFDDLSSFDFFIEVIHKKTKHWHTQNISNTVTRSHSLTLTHMASAYVSRYDGNGWHFKIPTKNYFFFFYSFFVSLLLLLLYLSLFNWNCDKFISDLIFFVLRKYLLFFD